MAVIILRSSRPVRFQQNLTSLTLSNGIVKLHGGRRGGHAQPGLQDGFAPLVGAQRLDPVAQLDVGLHQQPIGVFPAVILLQNRLAEADNSFPGCLPGQPLGQTIGGMQKAGAQPFALFVGPGFVGVGLQVVAFVEGNGRFIPPIARATSFW